MYNPRPIMSANSFPTQIEPYKWAEQGFEWSGTVPLSRFPRIMQEVVSTGQDTLVQVDCKLSLDYRRIAWMTASLKATLQLECQRCLQPSEHQVEASIHLALIADERKIERLDDELEDYIVLDESEAANNDADEYQYAVDLLAVLEDEFLLALPFAPKHDSCEVTMTAEQQGEQAASRPNPFAMLAELKKNLDS